MAPLAHHFDFLPGDATDAQTQSLGGSFLGSKTGGESIVLAVTESQLLARVDSLQETVTPSFDYVANAVNFYDVYTGNKHFRESESTTVG